MSLDRRELLAGAAAAGGSLLLGVQLEGCAPPQLVPAAGARAGEVDLIPNAWLRITSDDRVVLMLASVEMGQGTTTSHAMLVAEELGVDPRRIEVEPAPASRDYDNPAFGFQITGGSTSLRTSWTTLREAGAAARELLVAAAASRWNVLRDACVVRDGVVLHPPSERRARFGELVSDAARRWVRTPQLKAPEDFQVIGRPIPRLDAKAKCDGSAVFGLDVRVPGMARAVVLRPPVLGSSVLRFDAARARAIPGVVEVLKIKAGVAVVAETTWQARVAAAQVEVEWSKSLMDDTSSAGLRDSYARAAAGPGRVAHETGDPDAALLGAARLVEAVYELPFLAHATMEPQNCTARVEDGRCEVWAPTQSAAMARDMAERVTGFGPDAITIHTTMIGGGFGRRLLQDYVGEAVELAQKVKRPVQVVFSREDDLRQDYYRPSTHNVLRAGLDAQGNLVAWTHRIVGQSIMAQFAREAARATVPNWFPQTLKGWIAGEAVSVMAPRDPSTTEGSPPPYVVPHLRVDYVHQETGVPVGFWRSVGHSENGFVVEAFFDEVAHAAGRDPYVMRREMLSSARQLAVLDRAAAAAGWGTPLPAGFGRGIAMHHSFGSTCAQVVEVQVEEGRLRVHRVVAAVDCGRIVNPDIVRAQVEGGINFGLSATLKQAITLEGGRVQQTNFHTYDSLRMFEAPRIEVHLLPSDEDPSGIGEPPVPPAGPALANAIFAATGKRIRKLPIANQLESL